MEKTMKVGLESILDHIDDLIICISLEGEIILANCLITKILGYNKEYITGQDFFSLLSPEDKVKVKSAFEKDNPKGQSINLPLRIKNKEGNYKNFNFTAKIIEENQEILVVGTLKPTRRKGFKRARNFDFFRLYGTTLYSLFDAIFILNAEDPPKIIDCNPSAEEIFGYSRKEFIGRDTSFLHINNEYLQSFQKKLYIEIEKKGYLRNYYHKMRRKSGVKFPSEHSVLPLIDQYDRRIGWISVVRDISEKIQIEKKFIESEEKYRLIAENANLVILILDADGMIKYINKTPLKSNYKYEREELIGKRASNFIHSDYLENGTFSLIKHMKKGKGTVEVKIRHKDGHYVDVELNSSLFLDSQNQVNQLVIVRNITERKEFERELENSKEKYRLITENANDLIAILNEKYQHIFINQPAYSRLLGYSKEDMDGKTRFDIIHPEDLKRALDSLKKGAEMGEGSIELRLKHKDGHYLWIEFMGKKYYNQNGNVRGLLVGRDISQKKEAESKLRESEEKFKSIFNNSPIGIELYGSQGNLIEVNKADLEIFGFSEEMIPYNYNFFEDPNTPETIKDEFMQGKTVRFQKEYDFDLIKKNSIYPTSRKGKICHDVIVTPLRLADKEGFSHFFAQIRDITSQKLSEKKIEESEQKYRLITENTNDLIRVLDENFRIEFANEAHLRFLGYTSEELIGTRILNLIHPEEYPETRSLMKKVIKYGEAFREGRIKHKNGSWIWFRINGKRFEDKKGNQKYLFVTHNISERKETEQRLIDSEEKYRLITENANDLICVLNEKLRYEYVNEATHKKVLGYSKEELIGNLASKFVHKEDFKKITKAIVQTYKTGQAKYEERYRHKEGYWLWLDVKLTQYKEIEGMKKFLAIKRDISERKHSEYLLKKSEKKYRHLFEKSPNSIMILNTQGFILDCNSVTEEILGLKKEEIIGKSCVDLLNLSPEKQFVLTEPNKAIARGVLSESKEIEINMGENEKIWINLLASLVKLENSHFVQVIVQDITEKKNFEDLIYRQYQELSELSKVKSELLRRTSHELKTPLISIKGFSELLLTLHSDRLDDDTILIVKEIKQGCERLELLIHDILTASSLESGREKFDPQADDLGFLIKFCAQELKMIFKMRKQEIRLDLEENLITHFEKEKIYDVLNNLLTNASKFSPSHSQIYVKSEKKDDMIVTLIEDEGIGFLPSEKEKIFKQFGKIERYGKGWNIASEGTGLGLYIAKKIVELHNGKIWMDSNGRNQGSTFYFSLPIL
ncbi:MAG: PAS domain S-box protein [Candidatus Lokiarchaeota archaeon]|nr:PAS domain S-box protein [Candidatus Lokiarchaeota archaeon]MBD3342036.1 PAS domain S-box protein [Candidatus Lokiarchaeota archaeon]